MLLAPALLQGLCQGRSRDTKDMRQENGSEHGPCDPGGPGSCFCSLHKQAWGSPLYQSPLEAKEHDSPHPHLHGSLSNPEGVKARINQRIARRVRCFEGDEQGQRGELLWQSSQEGLSEEAAFHLRRKRKKEASHVRRGRTLQEKKSSSSPGGGGLGAQKD